MPVRRSCALVLLAAGACSLADERPPDPFTATGEVIALSGGDAGASNACFGCHGLEGQGDGAGAPRLAGLGAGYLARQLEYYAEGLRYHPQMHAIAKRLSWDDRQAVAAYYDAMPGALGAPTPGRHTLYQHGDPARGIPACVECHGANGEGVGLGNPPLAGQPAAYLAEQQFKWRRGERRGDPLGVMTRISQAMTPAEIHSVSAYAAALAGAIPRPGYEAASLPERRAGPRNDASAPRPRAAGSAAPAR